MGPAWAWAKSSHWSKTPGNFLITAAPKAPMAPDSTDLMSIPHPPRDQPGRSWARSSGRRSLRPEGLPSRGSPPLWHVEQESKYFDTFAKLVLAWLGARNPSRSMNDPWMKPALDSVREVLADPVNMPEPKWLAKGNLRFKEFWSSHYVVRVLAEVVVLLNGQGKPLRETLRKVFAGFERPLTRVGSPTRLNGGCWTRTSDPHRLRTTLASKTPCFI